MSQRRFLEIDTQLTVAQKASQEVEALQGHLEQIRRDLAHAWAKQTRLSQQLELKQQDVDELSQRGLASRMLEVIGKRDAIFAKEEDALTDLQRAYRANHKLVADLERQQAIWQTDLEGLTADAAQIDTLKAQQVGLIMTLPSSHLLGDILTQIEEQDEARRQVDFLIDKCSLVLRAFTRFFAGHYALNYIDQDRLEAVADSMRFLYEAFYEVQRPFWIPPIHPFSYFMDMSKRATPLINHLQTLQTFVETHLQTLQKELAPIQQAYEELQFDKQAMIDGLWREANFE